MPATTIGDVTFGLDEEAAVFAQSVSVSGSVEQKWVRNHEGDEVAGSLYGESYEFSIDGFINTNGGNSNVLAETISLANMPDFASGTAYITSMEQSYSPEDHQSLNISGVMKPHVSN